MIKDQVSTLRPDEVEELTLDSAHFGKFTTEIKAELGKDIFHLKIDGVFFPLFLSRKISQPCFSLIE